MKKKRVKPDAAAVSSTRSEYTASTPGLEDLYFTHGLNTMAAEFGVTRSRLAIYIGSKEKGSLGSKAMEEMKIPTLAELTKPAKQSMVSGVADMINAEYVMETQIYIIDLKEYKMKTNAWEELNANICNICLQHCPPVLGSVLKANNRWENISCN